MIKCVKVIWGVRREREKYNNKIKNKIYHIINTSINIKMKSASNDVDTKNMCVVYKSQQARKKMLIENDSVLCVKKVYSE